MATCRVGSGSRQDAERMGEVSRGRYKADRRELARGAERRSGCSAQVGELA